ncbi:hypothetical protein RFI_04029 [Reticulomyxa filosa]|uniref:Uncharacterized protein n=1 Tax=Reticulomyxa filosa TaxID=46433 RepID=X6P4N1_RETFI|nr:hypothetical protein RFI_04029 [Reticulomyxa filosa]|eukprot:ETO33078.1 hypothetical protein RFI_04029 [Reticulomyxa filosa]
MYPMAIGNKQKKGNAEWKASDKLFRSLKLENETWLDWKNVEKALNFDVLLKEIESSINSVFETFDNNTEINLNDPIDKHKVLSKICKEFNIVIPSKDLSGIQTKTDIVGWIFKKEKENMIKKWRRERYMPYNLPENLIVELPWYYCLGKERSPWTRPMGTKA